MGEGGTKEKVKSKSATWSMEMIGVENTYYKSLPLPLHLLPWISVWNAFKACLTSSTTTAQNFAYQKVECHKFESTLNSQFV
jgi:hypothetical protein